ncbi:MULTISPECIES: SCO family protein [Paracoccus]|uniref:SCO family protein n=1 Tax=Paracoccus TaxID=265 RepID=UPI0005E7F933|nr:MULTISPECIES: SCO family protein [unclassified Paracoccus (in: a-proteobacteria)]KIX16559.1 electron transporter SenC [Paracoccus sp. 228]
MTRQTLRLVRVLAWTAVVVAGAALLWATVLRPAPTDHQVAMQQLGKGDYTLVTADGQPFTQADLQGQPTAVFFGFTHCPDVCPTTLGEVTAWQDELARDGQTLRTLFITVDPERDTREVLGEYVSWVPGVTGITGERAEIDKAVAAFRAFAQRVPLEGGDYTVNHSTQVLLFDDGGDFFGLVSYQEDHDRAMGTIRRLLAS